VARPVDFDGPATFSRIPSRIFTHSKRLLGGGAGTVNPAKALLLSKRKNMKSDKSEMCSAAAEGRVQRFRGKSRHFRETALTMASEVDRRDMEWLAETYEILASSAERLERAELALRPAFN